MSKKRRQWQTGPASLPGNDPLFSVSPMASMTECTGLLPAQPETPDQRRNAARLGAIHPPENE